MCIYIYICVDIYTCIIRMNRRYKTRHAYKDWPEDNCLNCKGCFCFCCDYFLRGHTLVAGCLNSQTLRRHTPRVFAGSTATANLTSTPQVCGLGPQWAQLCVIYIYTYICYACMFIHMCMCMCMYIYIYMYGRLYSSIFGLSSTVALSGNSQISDVPSLRSVSLLWPSPSCSGVVANYTQLFWHAWFRCASLASFHSESESDIQRSYA